MTFYVHGGPTILKDGRYVGTVEITSALSVVTSNNLIFVIQQVDPIKKMGHPIIDRYWTDNIVSNYF